MGIHLRLGGDDWGIIFTWDSFQPSTPVITRALCYLQWFWRITEAGVMEGHPVETRRFWFGLPPELSRIDAVYERVGDGRIVFFSGNSRTF